MNSWNLGMLATEAGINTMTLHRARKQLGLRTRQTATGWIVS